jgi:hypothetical protein
MNLLGRLVGGFGRSQGGDGAQAAAQQGGGSAAQQAGHAQQVGAVSQRCRGRSRARPPGRCASCAWRLAHWPPCPTAFAAGDMACP